MKNYRCIVAFGFILLAVGCTRDTTPEEDICHGPSFEEIYPEVSGCWQWVRRDVWNLGEGGNWLAHSDTADFQFEVVISGNSVRLFEEGELVEDIFAGDMVFSAFPASFDFYDQGYVDGVRFYKDCGDNGTAVIYRPDSILVSSWPQPAPNPGHVYYNYFARCEE